MRRYLAIALGILGVLLFSTKAVLVKLAYGHGVDTISLLLLRMAFALPFYLFTIFVLWKKESEASPKDYLWTVFFGFLGYYLASFLDFWGLQFLKASIERLVLFTYPSLVFLISYFFLGKSGTKYQFISLAISYTGIVIVFAPELSIGQEGDVLSGGTLVFLSGLSYAIYIAGSGWLIPKMGALRFTAYCMTVSCTLVLIHFLVVDGELAALSSLPQEVFGYAFLMAIFATVIPSYLISLAIKTIGANGFALYGSLGPISTIGLAYFFLGENLSFLQWVGGMVVILGVALPEIARKKQ